MDGFSYNANFTAHNNYSRCFAENGIIYAIDINEKRPVGYTNDEYNALAETTKEYYDKLVELGVIVPEKSAEEILKDTQKALQDSQAINLEMLKILKDLRGGTDVQSTNDNVTTDEAVPKQGKRNQSSNKQSEPSDTGSN